MTRIVAADPTCVYCRKWLFCDESGYSFSRKKAQDKDTEGTKQEGL